VIDVTVELALADTVRAWVAQELPDEPTAASRAIDLAVRSYTGGASVSEACAEARAFVHCWARHPSHPRATPHAPLRLVS